MSLKLYRQIAPRLVLILLDLDINVVDGRFVSKLYDERRDFGFLDIIFSN